MSLSKKFSQLSGARASSANVKTVRIAQNTISQQNQRNNLQNQRRSLGGSTVIIQKGTGKQANNKKSALNLLQKNLANRSMFLIQNTLATNVWKFCLIFFVEKGAAAAGVKGKRGAGKPVQKKEEPKTATDFDMEMDKCN